MFRTKLKVKYIHGTNNPKMYKLRQGLIFEDTTVFAGFETDFASVPKSLQWLYTPQGKYSRSAVLHDYLYSLPNFPKELADDMFFRAMKSDGVDIVTRHLFYWAVKYFGDEYKA